MLKIGDIVLQVDKKTQEIVDVLTISKHNSIDIYVCYDSKQDLYLFDSNQIGKGRYELLTKDHEQRYNEYLYKNKIKEWFFNYKFSLEEMENMYNLFNTILETDNDKKLFFETIKNPREPNEALKKAFKNRNKFFTDKEL